MEHFDKDKTNTVLVTALKGVIEIYDSCRLVLSSRSHSFFSGRGHKKKSKKRAQIQMKHLDKAKKENTFFIFNKREPF